jgi:hypothetical protein
MKAVHLMRASAAVLLVAGLALLFAADDILPRFIPAFPPEGAWLGQLLAGAWLGAAALNWLNRGARLGGIYGRPVVGMNAILFFISAIVLLKFTIRPGTPSAVALPAAICAAFAVLYGWLMFRGPLAGDAPRSE